MVKKITIYIPEETFNRFIKAVKNSTGRKWRNFNQEINNAFIHYLEQGPLSEYDNENTYSKNLSRIDLKRTTGDVEKLTVDDFLTLFDNGPMYAKYEAPTFFIKHIVNEITGKDSDYNWRKWSKILRETGRIKQVPGTDKYYVYRERFTKVADDWKEQIDKQVSFGHLESFDMNYFKISDKAQRCYKKISSKNKVSIKTIRKLGYSDEEISGLIKELTDSGLLELKGIAGSWKVIDPITAKEKLEAGD